MILKRMISSLRRQDWTMVAIEFALVVVGVLLAFQINDWSNARSQEHERHEAMERLLDESERDIAHLKEGLQFLDKVVKDLNFALDRVERGSWSPADEERMNGGFLSGRYMTAIVVPTSVYEDIVASGSFNKIGTPELRAKISAFHGTLDYDERTRQQWLPVLLEYDKLPEFKYRIDPSAVRPPELIVDYAALAKNPDSERIIALTSAHQYGLRWIRSRALNESIEMCRALAESLGRTCNEHRPLPVFN